MTSQYIVHVNAAGELVFVYDDDLAGLLALGTSCVARASHVEPARQESRSGNNGWIADLRPSGGPVLGPFDTRGEALAAERKWLDANL